MRRSGLCSLLSSPSCSWLGGLDRHLQLFRKLLVLTNTTGKIQLTMKYMTLSPNHMNVQELRSRG